MELVHYPAAFSIVRFDYEESEEAFQQEVN